MDEARTRLVVDCSVTFKWKVASRECLRTMMEQRSQTDATFTHDLTLANTFWAKLCGR
jgi:hypothetical protein